MHRRVAELLTAARVALLVAAVVAGTRGAEDAEIRELIEQNRRLQEQVRAQQQTITELNAKVSELARATDRNRRDLQALQERGEAPAAARPPSSNRDQEVRISAEVGLAFFKTGSEGQYPSSTFRVDDAVIALEAPVFKDVYFFTELKLLPRETNAEEFELGEMYVDFENVSAAWGMPGLLNVRVGRLWIPFGEEYLQRSPLTNPLISHSLADIWGVDEGVEIYGRMGPLRYVLAVQNGGESRLRDFNSDKSVAGRLSWSPVAGWNFSASAMRTGELDAVGDALSEVWFGNGFFRSIGGAATTRTYWAELYAADGSYRWRNGHVAAAAGHARYDDDDTAASNERRMRYGSVEVVQGLTPELFAAARHSLIRAPGGYPLVGWGRMGTFFFRPVLATELTRTSLGVGYRFGPPLLLKFEYAWESGRMTTGVPRDHENFFGSEIAVKF
jgi:uncharacterized coiled-coil protein SlyX